jgi:glycerol kinase
MSKPQFILACDQGTSSSRAVLVDHTCRACAQHQVNFEQIYSQSGWVEHSPEALYLSQINAIRGVLNDAQVTSDAILAMGITNQRETTIVWNRRTGRPVYNAIVWQDRRTADFCQELDELGYSQLLKEKTGLRFDPYFSASKIRWILDHVENARALARNGDLCFGTVETWLVWQFTGGRIHCTDVSNASRTALLNIHTQEWDDELLEIFQIPRALLPEIRSCSEVYGQVATMDALYGVPIAGLAGDQQAALFGQACLDPGMVKCTYGTGCFVLMQTGGSCVTPREGLLSTIAWQINGQTKFALEGSVFMAGAIIQWLIEKLELVRDVDELNRLANSVEDSGGVVLIPAFTGLGAPHWDTAARGTICGLERSSSRAHLCRAALEAIALQSHDLIQLMQSCSGLELRELRVDGGVGRSELLLQLQANLLQCRIMRSAQLESTALGAAYFAGLALGFWRDEAEIAANWNSDWRFSPRMVKSELSELQTAWQKGLERAKSWTLSQDCDA